MKNKKGQTIVLGLMIAIFVFIVAVVLIPSLKDMVDDARDTNSLDCDNTSISTGQKGTCLIVDLYIPYFIGAVLAAGAAYIFVRKVT